MRHTCSPKCAKAGHKNAPPEPIAITVLASPDRIAELDSLMALTGLRDRRELINAALSLFEWAVQKRQAGDMIAAVIEGKGIYFALDFAPLNRVRLLKQRVSERLYVPDDKGNFEPLIKRINDEVS